MYFVGIDISKYKPDCFIAIETGEIIEENLSFQNTNERFNQLLNLLKLLENNHEIRIRFEATGHYGVNLKLFLEKNNYSFMEFYHKFSLKSLSRKRDKLVSQKSYYLNQITNILDLIFPEFKPLFDNDFSVTSLYILSKYKTPDKIKNMKDFDSINKL